MRSRGPERSIILSKPKQPFASLYFFPVAAAYALFILPWSVAAQFGFADALPGLNGPMGHAHEMLFGFAMAVVAGYILGPQPQRWILVLLGLWLAARLLFLHGGHVFVSAGLNVAFVGLLAYRVVPRFARTAKKWRNKAIAPIIAGLCFAGAGFQGLFLAGMTGALHGLLLEAILLLSLLMFFMGGRMLAPAVAGHLLKQKFNLEARVQPRIEGSVLITMAMILVFNLIPWPSARVVTAILLMVIAGLTLTRLWRWQMWRCLDRSDLLALGLGYLWLVAGWLLIGLALLTDCIRMSTAVHGLTVGALGTLTLTVMARTRAQRSRKEVPGWVIYTAVALISAAAVARLLAGTVVIGVTPYTVAASSWSLAFLLLFIFLLSLIKAEQHKGR